MQGAGPLLCCGGIAAALVCLNGDAGDKNYGLMLASSNQQPLRSGQRWNAITEATQEDEASCVCLVSRMR
jgi:hypothetical protein